MTEWIRNNFSIAGAIYIALMCSGFVALSVWCYRGKTPEKFQQDDPHAGNGNGAGIG
jgi:hypothetical protein